eukprot:TRINITY_DN238_c1_g1_i2.p1 TRINITY_DN238_c1_g1~~TRINITY_DN238_c1_g1_i2.p1  ORF type:complete len:2228 (-),score=554.58 TRINITY_DN238_c1_g1_i2:294-5987(-)
MYDDDDSDDEEDEEERRRKKDEREKKAQKERTAAGRRKKQQQQEQPSAAYVLDPTRNYVDMVWLQERCVAFLSLPDSASFSLSAFELSDAVLKILKSKRTDAELQGELFEFLGFHSFEIVSELLQNRTDLVDFTAREQQAIKDKATAHLGTGDISSGPSPHGNFTVCMEEDKMVAKRRRKEERRLLRERKANPNNNDDEVGHKGGGHNNNNNNTSGLTDHELARLMADEERGKADREHRLHKLIDIHSLPDANLNVSINEVALPAGAERKRYATHEEVKIPLKEMPPMADDEHLIEISELEPFAQKAFKGYKTLNRIQSKIFQFAHHTNENLLVCAPTGAGKTNVAMLTILNEIRQHIRDGYIHKDEFKVVYVAPMKALAAEMVRGFGKRLASLGIVVKEYTGDMSLTKRELAETQMIITTPEKWDVTTRKTSDAVLTSQVKLLILDEVHLLNEDRGPVIETLVSRTLRQVESSQSMIRIVGLSATLPNHRDVAEFLRVNPAKGLFYFDERYRPVPLQQEFCGVLANNIGLRRKQMNEVCYDKALRSVSGGHQVMVFVHSRKDTARVAEELLEFARQKGHTKMFAADPKHSRYTWAMKEVQSSHSREFKELGRNGFGMHHAGMLRRDRNIVEKLFGEGMLRVLVCTATLAWGVNLPAHTVIIRGTQLYNPKKGGFHDLGMLDVMQIFGRAGRPQYDKSGEAIMITTNESLPRYLRLLSKQLPIESQFGSYLSDHLNAEICLGTVTNMREGVQWLSYTYMHLRQQKNPMKYGIQYSERDKDPTLISHRREQLSLAAKELDECRMIRFDESSGQFFITELGRVASHYYIRHDTIRQFNVRLKNSTLTDSELLNVISEAEEFENVRLRDDEMDELERMSKDKKVCPYPVKLGPENLAGKVNILLQAYISNARIESFSLISDTAYISQNAGRISRALFEIVRRRGWPTLTGRLLNLCKIIDLRMWDRYTPLRQFPRGLSPLILSKIEDRGLTLDDLYEMDCGEIGEMIRHPKMGPVVAQWVSRFPFLDIQASVQPITRTILRIKLNISADFEWHDATHGAVQPFWIWVEDSENDQIYHAEYYLLHRKHASESHELEFAIPVFEPMPSQYYVRAVSDRWLHSDTTVPLSFSHLILPEYQPPHTELLDLVPLPTTALQDPKASALYPFSHFNPIQTQVFHTMRHTDHNVLMGAPTGSGKTIVAELAMLKIFAERPGAKVIYIGPLKALVRERWKDWQKKFVQKFGKKMVEMTGDVTPDIQSLRRSDIVLTTPEKWDGISRTWRTRSYVKDVALVIIDEIHLLGEDRGPVLEVIVSRMRYISSQINSHIRFVGLSTALANPRDVAEWLGIHRIGLYNFKPSVRPVPLDVHIQGFPGKNYCPRMATMNKPAYAAICSYSPTKPVLIFVSSRRQTRLTALDIMTSCAGDDNPRRFCKMTPEDVENSLGRVQDPNLKHTLAFGVGIHHAGLSEGDREVVESLFGSNKIQVLVSTSTLAWGVNLPAHLVIVKGTEYFDGKTKRYVDFPITDVLQMMGRAGRPQFDHEGKACIFVHQPKLNFYRKFLYEPFPVESHLKDCLHNHINAEIVSGTIVTMQDAVDYLTWTYFYRRLLKNPSYYQLESVEPDQVNLYLSRLVSVTLMDLRQARCVKLKNGITLEAQSLGRIASYYYLSYKTMDRFRQSIRADAYDIPTVLRVLCSASEYDELPVRHNEDKLNEDFAKTLPWCAGAAPNDVDYEDPHVKAHLLLQAHFRHVRLPIADYVTDTKSVMDQVIRILQAMVDVASDLGFLFTTLSVLHLMQMVTQGRADDDSTLLNLPHVTTEMIMELSETSSGGGGKIDGIRGLIDAPEKVVLSVVNRHLKTKTKKDKFLRVYHSLPRIEVDIATPEIRTVGDEGCIRLRLRNNSKV